MTRKTFVVSDIWFNRPNVDHKEMGVVEYNNMIIRNWNKSISRTDVVYILGGIGISDLYGLIVKLNGEIHILNNYYTDEDVNNIKNLKELISKSVDKKLSKKIIFEDCQIKVLPDYDCVLSYLPLSDWYGKDNGTYCFHGLNKISDFKSNFISSVISEWEFEPVEINSIKNNINKFFELIS